MEQKELAELTLKAACEFQGMVEGGRQKAREAYKAKEEAHFSLRVGIDGLLARLAQQMTVPVKETSPEISYQIGLLATFTRTHFVVSDLIMGAELVEAVTLLRKNLEVLARILEIDKLPLDQITGKTPNVKYAFADGKAPIYGHLSEVAHFSTPEATELLQPLDLGDRIGPRLIPAYDERAMGYMDLLHFLAIRFSQWQLFKLTSWHKGAKMEIESSMFVTAMQLALELGVIQDLEKKAETPGNG